MSVGTQQKQPAEIDPRLQHAYAHFLLHLKGIAACVEGGCSVKSVWRAYALRDCGRFPGSYSSFLRYCRKHDLVRVDRKAPGRPPSESTAVRAPTSLISQPKRYPPPRTRPPGVVPSTEELEL